jgi:sugar phosphate isomerase/epimerase
MALRLGYVTNGLTSHRLEDALELLVAEGYDGVALTLDHVHFDPDGDDMSARAERLGHRLDELGLDRVVETGARFILDPRRKHFPTLMSDGRERRLDLLIRAVDVAAALGAPVVSTWSGAAPADVSPPEARARLLAGCEALIAHADARGIAIGFEPEPGMAVETITDWEVLGAELGHPQAFGMTLDISHCVCLEPDPVATCVRRAAPALRHVHIADMIRGVHEHLMFGEGELNVSEATTALEEIGYRGMVAVELSRHSHDAHRVAHEAITLLRAEERSGAIR